MKQNSMARRLDLEDRTDFSTIIFYTYLMCYSNIAWKTVTQWHVSIQTKFESTWCVHHRDLNNGKNHHIQCFAQHVLGCAAQCSHESWVMNVNFILWLCGHVYNLSLTIHHHTVPFAIWYVSSQMILNMWYVWQYVNIQAKILKYSIIIYNIVNIVI